MIYTSKQLVTKLSVSDILASKSFYETVLGFVEDEKYTINNGGNYGLNSYLQLNTLTDNGGSMTIGLYKDIEKPFESMPLIGTVPSFIVEDIYTTLDRFLKQEVLVVAMNDNLSGDDKYIIKNTSDKGYVDLFFFFCDPDKNSLVIRQNLGKE